MRVSDFMKPSKGRKPKTVRDGADYRCVRREEAKVAYRAAKRKKG